MEAGVSYPNREETGFCQPVINITLFMPSGKDRDKSGGGGGSSPSSSSSGDGGVPGNTEFMVLVDIACHDSTCEITKYYKKLLYDDNTYIVYWTPPSTGGSVQGEYKG
jgi:hypothetical protein